MRRHYGLTRQQLRLDQRRRVLAAARCLLAAGGWPAMTLEAVARQAHVSKSDLNLLAPSREQLAADVYTEAATAAIEAVRDGCDTAGNDPLASAIAALANALDADPERALVLLRTEAPPGRAPARARAAAIEAMAAQLRRCTPRPISDVHARIVCGGLRELLADLVGHQPPAQVAEELTALCVVLRDGP